MSPRRLIPVLGLGALAFALAGACLPWSVAAPGLTAFVGRALAQDYGISLVADGRTEVALLPMPRLSFRRVRLSAGGPDGPVLAQGGMLTIQLNPAALMQGRAEVATLALDGAMIALPAGADDGRWAGPVRRLTERLSVGASARPRRITISHATATAYDPRDGTPQTARNVDLALSWPLWSAGLDIAGGFTWREKAARFAVVGLRAGDLAAGRPSPFTATAAWPAGSLAVEGSAAFGESRALAGRVSLRTRSMPETLAWLGADLALSPVITDLDLEGRFETQGGTLMLPALRVSVGDNRLEGAGSATFGGRTAIQATLAAETLNLAPLLAGLVPLFESEEASGGEAAWGRRDLALAPLTGGDLDLRLSAGSARLGPLLLAEVAAGLLVREGSIEASLGRAGLRGGTLKGRIAARGIGDGAETEIKAQGAFDRLDLGGLMVDLGQSRWVLGPTQGQFALEGTGRDVGGLMRRVGGRAALAIDGGAIEGLDLADVIQRGGALASGAPARGGRTAFERAAVSLRFADGIGEITEGALTAPALTASLRGTISLPERRFRARAGLLPRPGMAETGAAPTAALFEIAGPWNAVAVRADGRGADPEEGSRGGSLGAPDPLRIPAAAPGLPAAARAYAP